MNIILKVASALLISFFSCCTVSAIEESMYSAGTIPDSLKANAYSVIRNYSVVLTQGNKNQGNIKFNKVITVLEAKGEDHAHFIFSGDRFRELTNFSGSIKDATGKELRKIKKGDLTNSSFDYDINTLVTDNNFTFYKCKSPVYPFTVEYSYEVKLKNGILTYYPFSPVDDFCQSVEKATYQLNIPQNETLRYKANFDCPVAESSLNETKIYNMSLSGLKAIPKERMMPPAKELFPYILLSPTEFCFDSHCGNLSTWKEYGLWVNDLLKGRDILPEQVAGELKKMTQNAKDEREKVKILYEYLQKTTRYVSIQLGIGGFQPIDAATVYKVNFGDCKGLSNLMKAMLKTIGIASNYCEISTKYERLYAGFSNVNQTDHVILLVPLEQDSIWLECTSSVIPFGYIPSNLAGHDALVISDEGGEICRLPKYRPAQNLEKSILTLSIDSEGNTSGSVVIEGQVDEYEKSLSAFVSKDREKYIRYLNTNLKFPQIKYKDVSMTENRDAPIPSTTIRADFDVSDYVNKTGKRMFIPVCPLAKTNFSAIFTSSKRQHDLFLPMGFSEIDSIIINLPENSVVENLPKSINLRTDFGTLTTGIKAENNRIVYTQQIQLFSGRFDKSKYEEIKNFYAKIAAILKGKIVIQAN